MFICLVSWFIIKCHMCVKRHKITQIFIIPYGPMKDHHIIQNRSNWLDHSPRRMKWTEVYWTPPSSTVASQNKVDKNGTMSTWCGNIRFLDLLQESRRSKNNMFETTIHSRIIRTRMLVLTMMLPQEWCTSPALGEICMYIITLYNLLHI